MLHIFNALQTFYPHRFFSHVTTCFVIAGNTCNGAYSSLLALVDSSQKEPRHCFLHLFCNIPIRKSNKLVHDKLYLHLNIFMGASLVKIKCKSNLATLSVSTHERQGHPHIKVLPCFVSDKHVLLRKSHSFSFLVKILLILYLYFDLSKHFSLSQQERHSCH